jgi:ectoine hydroxylase-related dioxygenase (phytanoyl-CoA dioxygenase family)
MLLSQEQIDFFHQNGYLKWGPLLDEQTLETLQREYDAIVEACERTNEGTNYQQVDEDGQLLTKEQRRVFQLLQVSTRNIHFRKLLFHETIVGVLKDLIGPNLMLFHDQMLYKPPHTGGAVPWHQDNSYWQCRPANLISCWLTLDDVIRESGAMQVIPGSHLRPVWHERYEEVDAPTLSEIKGVDASQADVIELPAGGCMFHHCQTLHYTEPNTTERHRRAFAIHYMVPGTVNASHDKGIPVSFGNPLVSAQF